MSSNPYLDALNAKAVQAYLTAVHNAATGPAQSAGTPPSSTTSDPANPSLSAGSPTTGAATQNSSGGLLSDGKGGFIPAPGTNYGDHYGIVMQSPDGRVVLNTPQGPQGYASAALAQAAAQQQGIPYQPALPIVGNATADQLNGFFYGVNEDGTPSNATEQQNYINGMSAPGKSASDSSADKSAMAYLTNLLRKYGLDSLAGWAMDQLKSGASQDEIIQSLRDQPEYKTRFAGMGMRATNGLGAMSEDEYIATEGSIEDYMQRAGITGYRTPGELAPLIGNFANVGQVADRIQNGFQKVAQAPPEVRQEFARWFGADGDAALATYFLDPSKAEPELIKQANVAQIGGTGLRQGLDVSQQMAGSLADMGMSTQQIQGGFAQAGTLAGLQSQTVDEASAQAAGLTADQIAGGTFGSTGTDQKAVKNKLDSRAADFATKGTALSSVTTGAIGLS